jgi:hypothetical protein
MHSSRSRCGRDQFAMMAVLRVENQVDPMSLSPAALHRTRCPRSGPERSDRWATMAVVVGPGRLLADRCPPAIGDPFESARRGRDYALCPERVGAVDDRVKTLPDSWR